MCCAVLAVSTWQVLTDGPLRAADERWGRALRDTVPVPPAELLADLGNMEVALPLLAVALALALWRDGVRAWWPALCYALALPVMAALVSVLKSWTDRPGPLGGTGFYPSGHAATTVVALGGAALLLTSHVPRRAVPFCWGAVVVLSVANGLGLVWRGYHWSLDVVASWCLSVLLLMTAAATARRAPPLSGRRRSTARDRE